MLQALLWTAAAVLGALYIAVRWICPYFWDDVKFCIRSMCIEQRMQYLLNSGTVSLVNIFMEQALEKPDKPFVIYEGDVYTYQDVDKRSNKVAHVFLKEERLAKVDVVALLMNNELEYISTWFGLRKMGFTVAMLNVNIKAKSLEHRLMTCNAKALVAGADMSASVKEILPFLHENTIGVWTWEKASNLPNVNSLPDKIESASDGFLPTHLFVEPALHLFTSGTTGLPKAAIITHSKIFSAMQLIELAGATKNEVPLPLFHCSIWQHEQRVLKKKFSVSQFWSDCRKYDVSMLTYVSEICRYLCSGPKKAGEKNHKVRLATGVGLRRDVWKEFAECFGVYGITESYGSTESNVSFINYTVKIGAIGRAGFLNKLMIPFEFLKYDVLKEEVVRDETGRCFKAKKGEVGLLVCQVTNQNPFCGYAGSVEQTQKKRLRNVLKEGDVYYNSGDLMKVDKDVFVYFCDRVGDTFRWKGENVSTTEVAEILKEMNFKQEVNVYGVPVSGYEGKIGMASLVLRPQKAFNGQRLYEAVVDHLPAYARPFFLRIQDTMNIHETFKYKKVHLVKEGFNPSAVADPLYVLDCSSKTYKPLTKEMYEDIISGKLQL